MNSSLADMDEQRFMRRKDDEPNAESGKERQKNGQ